MFKLNYHIQIGNYTLRLIDSLQIQKSVERLSDTAVIVLPSAHLNEAIRVEDRIKKGDAVEIQIGYDDRLVTEFKGYLISIQTDDGSIKLECEDDLYLFRQSLENRELKNITLKNLLNEVTEEINRAKSTHYKVICDYDFLWSKFVVYNATGYDMLTKVQDETKANIYFKNGELHIHPQYSHIDNEKAVVYDFFVNIEKSELKYKTAEERKIEIEVTATAPDGSQKKKIFGTPGGDKKNINAGTADEPSMQKLAEETYKQLNFDGYEGNFTTWLVPYCEPAYKIRIQDADYPEKTGNYYVVSTDTEFSKSGGIRKITIGMKIG